MKRQDWVRTVALGAVLVSSAALSYATLRDRATHVGFPEWAVWFYPIAVDATILGASRTWRDATLTSRTRVLAAAVTIGAICAAGAAFVAEHIEYGWVGVGFAAVIPLALAAVLVLTSWSEADRRDVAAATVELRDAVALRREAQRERDEAAALRRTVQRPPRRTEPKAPVALSASVARTKTAAGTNAADAETRRQWVRDRLANGVATTGADVDHQFGEPRNGARIVRRVQQEQQQQPPTLAVAD